MVTHALLLPYPAMVLHCVWTAAPVEVPNAGSAPGCNKGSGAMWKSSYRVGKRLLACHGLPWEVSKAAGRLRRKYSADEAAQSPLAKVVVESLTESLLALKLSRMDVEELWRGKYSPKTAAV